MFNNSSLNALRPRGRLLSVDTDGTVLAVVESSNWNNGWNVDVPPGSRRPFLFWVAYGSNFGLLNESNTDIQIAVSGTSTAVLFNTDLVLVTETDP